MPSSDDFDPMSNYDKYLNAAAKPNTAEKYEYGDVETFAIDEATSHVSPHQYISPGEDDHDEQNIFCDDDDPFVDDSDTDEDMPELECCDETISSDGIEWEQEDEHVMFEQYFLEHGLSMPDV